MKRLAVILSLSLGCSPEIPSTPPGTFMVARFDPSAAPAVVPTPNDLVTNATTGLLSVPIPADASPADRWFYDWLNTLNGFPSAATAVATFTSTLEPSTVTAASVRVLDISANHASVEVTRAVTETSNAAAPGQLTVSPPAGGWVPGHRYAVAVLGGASGVRSKDGLACVGSATWALLRAARPLVDCPNADLTAPTCRLVSELVPSAITEDPQRRLDDQLATARRLEGLRRRYEATLDALERSGVLRAEVALLWTFKIDDSASVVFDPSASPPRVASPNDLAIRQGLVTQPIDANASAATQEWTRTWLNTLDGFPASSIAGVDVSQQPLDPSSITARSVRVFPLTGAAFTGAPGVSWNASLRRLVITPPASGWGTATKVAVALVGGESGLRAVNGQRVVASQTFAFVRSSVPLVDCAVLGPSCGSLVKAAPISVSQAVALESLRRGLVPVLDRLEAMGVARRDVAGAWTFTTSDQPELVFEPAAGQLPMPNEVLIDPVTGLVNQRAAVGSSAATVEFTNEYLNTLDGFPVDAVATANLGGAINPATVTSSTVRVQLLSGPALAAPTVGFELASNRITVTPSQGRWLKGQRVAVVVLGGSSGVQSTTGKPLRASLAFSYARLASSLVDSACSTVGPSCRSVTALSDAQAIALEPIRRALLPVFDSLDSTGIQRQDIAGLWVFRVVNQSELTFDPLAGITPFPSNLLRGNALPDGGVGVGFVRLLADGGAPDETLPGLRLSVPGQPALQTLDGFSLTAPIVSENSRTLAAVDLDGLDAGSLGGAGFVKLDGPSTDAGVAARVCLNCVSSLNDAGVLSQPEQLQWVPQTPLEEGSRYAAFVTTAVRTRNGRPVMASPTFGLVRLRNSLIDAFGASAVAGVSNARAQQLEPIRRVLQSCLDRMEAAGHPRRGLALAFCFTTQQITVPLQAALAAVTAPTTPEWVHDVSMIRALLPSPVDAIGNVVEVSVPMLATVVLPTATPPSTGYPVAIVQHALGRSRADALLVANALAAVGIATVAIDAPMHGDRSDCRLAPPTACHDTATQECSATTGRCIARVPANAQACTSGSDCWLAGQGRCLATGRCEGGRFEGPRRFGLYESPAVSGVGFTERVPGVHQQVSLDLKQLVRVLRASGPSSLNGRLTQLFSKSLDGSRVHFVGNGVPALGGLALAAATDDLTRLTLIGLGAERSDGSPASPGTVAFDEAAVFARTLRDAFDARTRLGPALRSTNVDRRLFLPFIEGDTVTANETTTALLQSTPRLAWYRYAAHAGTAATGQFPSTWSAVARHTFFFDPGSPLNPECDTGSTASNPMTCATNVVRGQVAQFLSSGVTPANVPVTP